MGRVEEGLQGFGDLDLRLLLDPGALQQHGQLADVVRTEDDVHPGGPLDDGVAVLLGETAADRDLHPGALGLHRGEAAEVAVELVVGVLPHRAGVEDDDVGVTVGALGGTYVTRALQQPRQPLGVVDVHLAPVGAHLVRFQTVHYSTSHVVAAHPSRVRAPAGPR